MTAQATRVEAAVSTRRRPFRSMAQPIPSTWERLLVLLVGALFWTATASYAIGFSLISLRQYHAYVPHALDLGNMAQAFYNTVHGHPFKFQNMRQNMGIEAFGTNTRLSFHVEPIIPFLSVIYFFYQHVETLLVMQSVAVATGAIPARLLARRHLNHPLAELTFPLVYLFFPALEAANLYEFHPVTFAAPLLLWAFYFADVRRYTLFVICAFAAMGCKEEIGILVALIGLWIALRNGERRLGAIVGVLGITWTFIALKVVVSHFNGGDSSYWGRYVDSSVAHGQIITQSDVINFWLKHPGRVWANLTSEPKLSYLHRLFYPAGYLSLLSPLTLLAALPGLLLILLSYEPHMYGGLAHYSAELVPVVVVSSILGTSWLCRQAEEKLHLPMRVGVLVCCAYILIATLANQRVNGFTPLAANFDYPPITAHDRVVDKVLAMIPPDAAVSAQDNLDAHLSDREQIYLYPDRDFDRVQWVVIDATQPTGSVIRPCDLTVQIVGNNIACDLAAGPRTPAPRLGKTPYNPYALLRNGKWTIVWAEDGVLLLERYHKGMPFHTKLPPAFWSFLSPPASEVPSGGPIARFGDYLQLEGYHIDRAERANLRNPDVVVTTWWRVLKPLPSEAQLMHYLSDNTGALQFFWDDDQGTDWVPLDQWQPGKIYKVISSQLAITTAHSGNIDVDLGVTTNDAKYMDISLNLPVHLLSSAGTPRAVGNGKVLLLTSVHASL